MHASGQTNHFLLEKRPKNPMPIGMWRAFRNLWHRPAVRLGLVRDSRGRFRDPRFVSFLAQNNRRTIDTHLQDAVLRGRRLVKQVLVLILVAGGAWFVLESAKAISMF